MNAMKAANDTRHECPVAMKAMKVMLLLLLLLLQSLGESRTAPANFSFVSCLLPYMLMLSLTLVV